MGVWNVVTSTMLPATYSRSAPKAASGWIDQCPASSSRMAAKIDALSKRGMHSQSMEPPEDTSAAEWRSESRA